jgi:hypothetical protein
MPAKVNGASAWANQMAGRSAQSGASHTATLEISTGVELFVACIFPCQARAWINVGGSHNPKYLGTDSKHTSLNMKLPSIAEMWECTNGLFYNAGSIPNYSQLNDGQLVNDELAYASKNWGKPWKASVSMAGAPVEIWDRALPHKTLQLYR